MTTVREGRFTVDVDHISGGWCAQGDPLLNDDLFTQWQCFFSHMVVALAYQLHLRRTIFLADANALVIPLLRLERIFAAINAAFAVAPAHLSNDALARWKAAHPLGICGIYSFIDAFTGTRKTHDAFAVLAQQGLGMFQSYFTVRGDSL